MGTFSRSWDSTCSWTTVVHSIRDLLFQTPIDSKLAEKCENSSFFVPKSIDDLRKITSKIKMDHLEQPVRIWTDYERFNRTHFWSKTANEWWQNVDHGGQGSTHCLVRARSVRVGAIFFDYSWCWCGPSFLVHHNWLLNLKNLKPKIF